MSLECATHVDYDSQQLADNAVILHEMAFPYCQGIHAFECENHFHIGHRSRRIGEQCKNHPEHLAAERRRHRV